MRWFSTFLLLALSAPFAGAQRVAAPTASAAMTPDLGKFYLEDAVDATFAGPVAVAFAPGGRMFVVEKRGMVWVVENGVRQPQPFVDLRNEVLDQHDRGLLGIAVDPDFEANRRVYLSYTVDHNSTADAPRLDAFARVTRFAGRADNPSVADLSTRRVLLGETFGTGIPSCYYSHTIGTLAFGSDGSLLVGAGDGASYYAVDPGGQYDACFGAGRLDASEDIGAFRSQRLESLAGKILRIDPRNGRGYASNPFYTGDLNDNASRVWALGVRNPYRFVVDPRGGRSHPGQGNPGRVYVGDVGWAAWEDLHRVRGGENLGWPCFEGPAPNDGYQQASPATNGCGTPLAGVLTPPDFTWHHDDPAMSSPSGRTARAIVGGAIYNGTRYPEVYRGSLFYGDYVMGWTAMVPLAPGGGLRRDRLVGTGMGPVVAYAYDAQTEYLYLVDVGVGRIRRLRHENETVPGPPVAYVAASPMQGSRGANGLRVQFSPDGSFSPRGAALTYAWTFGDGATSSERAPVHTFTEAGTYTATLTVSDGATTAQAATQVLVRGGSPPSIRITSPSAVTRGAAGQSVRLAADVSDPDQDPADLFVRWRVVQVHNEHIHFDVFEGADAETAFVVPDHGAPGDRVYYRVRAEVRDASGMTGTDEVVLSLAGDVGEVDVSATSVLSASVAAPAPGRGSSDLNVLTDGVTPLPGADASRQFATYTGTRDRAEDWVQADLGQVRRVMRLSFQEGLHWADGGWFEAPPRAQVRRGGAWHDVTDLRISPAYRADDGRPFDRYEIAFAPAEGDAVRLIGPPGGTAGFVSASELRVWAQGDADDIAGVPAPWTVSAVGPPGGSAARVGDAIGIEAAGRVAGTADRFSFVWQPLDADGSLVVRVDALTPDLPGAMSGVMLRASLDPGAVYGALVQTDQGLLVQARLDPDGPTTPVIDPDGQTAPIWLRVDRAGSRLSAFTSVDGETWDLLAEGDVPALGGPILAGLFVASGDDGETAATLLRHVALTSSAFTDGPIVGSRPASAEAEFGMEAVYPNPARARASVRVAVGAETELSVVDLLGRRLTEVPVSTSGVVSLDLRALPAGTYVLRLPDPVTGRIATRPVTVVR
ncbi:hypothetical protein B1759_04435 [Rubrivirga sp. SAORIC476]|uniref:PQQ-dependent sugar dehydrogenase n=1 Tax=Rubrivirga sp. SAORIC476 TaxID=1961794 RepID=UPI000BA8F24D|nr:PQQ-dependent sugar dehydrogenase [Rubrivirga sp. SAORIC476]PAP80633.1 hypothetical protein B1759_04435 [Rubrivirga sp. SAORIC476]